MSSRVVSPPEPPPPFEPPPWVRRRESNSSFVCWRSLEMSTFSCMPNTSGCWLKGRFCGAYAVHYIIIVSWEFEFSSKSAAIMTKSYLDKLHIVFIYGLWRCMIIATGGEGVAWVVNNVFVVEVSEDRHEEATVPVICYTTSVVTLSSQIRDGLKGNLLVLIHKKLRHRK